MLTHDDDQASREQDPARKAKILPFGQRRVPDWLTGPGDEMGAAEDPAAPEPTPVTTTSPVLRRPGAPPPAVDMEPGVESASASAFAVTPRPSAAPELKPEPEPIEPLRAKPRKASDPSAPWVPAASSVPVPKLSLVENPAPEPKAQAAAEPAVHEPPLRVLPGRDDDLRAPAAVASAPLVEPWWVVALDNLRANRVAQLATAGGLLAVVVLASWMWPRGVGTTPLSQIRRHPTEFDGREVVVRGRVGDDVFAVGAGWAFYLMQGRDTIVAFSLMRQPEPRRVVTLKGQVSTGFLDGMPRQALFEGGAQHQ